MKAFFLLLILAAGAFLLLNKPTAPKALPQPPVVASLERAAATPPPTPAPSIGPKRTSLNPSEPIIEAEGMDIAVIKGVVAKVDGEVATIDCEYRPPFDESTFVFPPGMSREYMLSQIAKAKAEFYAATFGRPQILDPQGKYVEPSWIPKKKTKGVVTLRGISLAEGQIVHLMGASVKRTTLGVDAVAYTARFKAVGSTWMWSETGRTGLEPVKP